jgi:hypothetical protein
LTVPLGRAFDAAERFIRKHLKTKAVRAAEKRRRERKAKRAAQGFGRAASVTAASGAGIAGYTLAIAPVGGAGLAAAGVATVLVAALAVKWPLRRPGFSREELAALPGQAEEWLLDRREQLPPMASDAFDRVLTHLADLQAQLGQIDPQATLAWDARRLIGDHLPRLVHAYCDLPEGVRDADPLYAHRLTEGLETLAVELGDLCRLVSRDRLSAFEAHRRFIEHRYKGDENLKA